MDYMLDKIKVHPKGDEIIKVAYDIVREIEENDKFDDSEKLLVIDLIVAKTNYDLFKKDKGKSE